MMKNQSKLILAFVAGAAAGAAVAYIVTSDKGEEIMGEIRGLAGKIRENVADRMHKASATKHTEETQGEEFMGV
jgi:hypothetical protein